MIRHTRRRLRILNLGLLIPDLVSFHLTLCVAHGYHNTCERTNDEGERCLQHSKWSQLPSNRSKNVFMRRPWPSETKMGRRIESINPETQLSYDHWVLSDMCAPTHQQRSVHSTQGVLWVQPNILSCALSQNNCLLLPYRISNIQQLTRYPEIDHFIIKRASQGSNHSGRKVNRWENESFYGYKHILAAVTKNCCDFFFKVQMPRYFPAANVKPLSYCYNNRARHDTISWLFFCCYVVSITDSE